MSDELDEKYNVFECSFCKEKDLEPLIDIQDIIKIEKGEDYYHKLVADRKRYEEEKKLKE